VATNLRELLGGALTSLRYEASEKRLRNCLSGELAADTVDGRHRERPVTHWSD
jgi:hypothetical protein